MAAPLVSIVIANYNYAGYLAEAIDSVLTQTYPAVEVIVVDDASTDHSREVMAAYGARIRPVFLAANQGQSAGYQAGFAVCRGDLICFLDSDDRLAADAVARVVAAWRPGLSKVHFRVLETDVHGAPLATTLPPAGLPLDHGDLAPSILKYGHYFAPPSGGNFYARFAVEAALPLMGAEHRIGADYPLMMVAAVCGEVAAIDAPLLFYRLHDRNNSRCRRHEPAEMADRVRSALATEAVILKAAAAFGHAVPARLRIASHCNARLALRLLHPGHYPLPGGSVPRLAIESAIAAFHLRVSPARRLRAALGLASVAVLPRPLARGLMTWVQYPERRPAGLWARARFLLGLSAAA